MRLDLSKIQLAGNNNEIVLRTEMLMFYFHYFHNDLSRARRGVLVKTDDGNVKQNECIRGWVYTAIVTGSSSTSQ